MSFFTIYLSHHLTGGSRASTEMSRLLKDRSGQAAKLPLGGPGRMCRATRQALRVAAFLSMTLIFIIFRIHSDSASGIFTH